MDPDAKSQAHQRYLEYKEKLKQPLADAGSVTFWAQQANDAWLEYKRLEAESTNFVVMKNLRDLFGVTQ